MKVLTQHVDGGMRAVGPGRFDLYSCEFTVGAEGAGAADAIDVTIQLTDLAGKAIRVANVLLYVYITAADSADLAAGTALTSLDSTDAALLIQSVTAGLRQVVITNASGQVVMRGTIAGANTRQLAVILPDGHIVKTGTLTWAA